MKIGHFFLTMMLLTGSSPSLIEATCCTCTPIANSTKTITITKPGNYALTQNITVPIQINVSDVVLDLCTFTVSLPAGKAGNAISTNGKNNVTIKNGVVTNPNANAISINNSIGSVVENVEVSGSSQALALSNSKECQVNFLTAFNNLNKAGAVVSLSNCNSIQLSNVQANNNGKALINGVVNGESGNAIIFIGTSSNVTLTECSACFNTRSINNTLFAPFEAVSSKSVSFINCLANDNSVITQADNKGFAPFFVQQCIDTIINGCQANRNNMAVSTSLYLRPICVRGSNRTIITYSQANDNTVSSFAVPSSTANQDLSGIAVLALPSLSPPLQSNDTVISYCQTSGNVVTNGGPSRTQNFGLVNGIYIQGGTSSGSNFSNRSLIEFCQANGNSMGTSAANQFVNGINIVATNDLTIANCSADGSNGGQFQVGILVSDGSTFNASPIGNCSSIKVLNSTANDNGLAQGTGIAVGGLTTSLTTAVQNCEIIGCQANNNFSGIFLGRAASCSVIDCSAKENTIGFFLDNCQNCLLKGNIAIGNVAFGFQDSSSGTFTNSYLGNYSENSATNYSISPGGIQIFNLDSSGNYSSTTGLSELANVSRI